VSCSIHAGGDIPSSHQPTFFGYHARAQGRQWLCLFPEQAGG